MFMDVLAAVGAFFVAVWKWLGDQQAPVIALATTVTAIIAWFALIRTAIDSRERSRPVVLAMFRLAEHNDSAFDFVVRNFGASAARDIDVKFDPPLDAARRVERLTSSLAMRYDRRIPVLPLRRRSQTSGGPVAPWPTRPKWSTR